MAVTTQAQYKVMVLISGQSFGAVTSSDLGHTSRDNDYSRPFGGAPAEPVTGEWTPEDFTVEIWVSQLQGQSMMVWLRNGADLDNIVVTKVKTDGTDGESYLCKAIEINASDTDANGNDVTTVELTLATVGQVS